MALACNMYETLLSEMFYNKDLFYRMYTLCTASRKTMQLQYPVIQSALSSDHETCHVNSQ